MLLLTAKSELNTNAIGNVKSNIAAWVANIDL